jgi:DNA-binding SARP family transcriptional activator
MQFRILGPLEVEDGGQLVPLGGKRQRALLALLLLRANEVVSIDRLVDELWAGDAPPTAAKIVQNAIVRLHKTLAERLVTRPPGYVLRVEPGELDRDEFKRLRAEGRPHDALALWRGPPLADLAYEEFAQTEIAKLVDVRLAVLEERIERDLAAGRDGELIGELEQLVTGHPLREGFRGQLMIAR